MAIDLYDTRTMLRFLEISKAPASFFRSMFFSNVNTSDTKEVDIDIRDKKRRIAPFVHPDNEGTIVQATGYETKTFAPPYIKPKIPTKASDLINKRLAGEPVGGNLSPMARARRKLGEDLMELREMVDRRIEWMCAEFMNAGSITLTGEGVTGTMNFGRDAGNTVTLTGTDLWTDTGSDPLKDLRDWKRTVVQKTGLKPDVAVFGENVLNAFINHEKVKSYMDNRRFLTNSRLTMEQQTDMGVVYVGLFEGLEVYAYDEWYDTGGGDTVLVPVDKVIMGVTRPAARGSVHFGAIQDLDANLVASVSHFPKSWITKDPSKRWVMVQSSPLPYVGMVNSTFSAKAV